MNYDKMVDFHEAHQADLTIATFEVPWAEASRFGILDFDEEYRVNTFIEKPPNPPSNRVNMGVYLFDLKVLDQALWEDHKRGDSSHDFGRDVLPRLVTEGKRVFAYPYSGYWVDVGTVNSYWQAHMDLLADPPPINLNDRQWIMHTRTEERPPVRIAQGAQIIDSMITDGCIIAAGARVERSVLSAGVHVGPDAVVRESILLTDAVIEAGAQVERAILDKHVIISENARVGAIQTEGEPVMTMVGKHSIVPAGMVVEPGAVIGPDVIPQDYPTTVVRGRDYIQTRRLPYEI